MRTGYINDQPRWTAKRQEEILRAAGVERFYREGVAGQTLEVAVRALRGDELLECAAGMRSLGSSRKEIMEALALIKKKGRVIVDPETKERSDRDGAEMLDRALAKIRYELTMPSEQFAKEIGSKGGKARAKKFKAGRMPENTARSKWLDRSIRTNREALLQMPGWSMETAYRFFGKSGRPPGRITRATRDGYLPPKSRPKVGSIYFIRANGTGPVKIGFSTDYQARIASMMTSHARQLRLVAVIRGSHTDEQALHKRFAKYRVRGEWFRVAGELAKYLESLPTDLPE